MRHRFLCCSDTHGQLPPCLDEADAVAWLHAGDVNDGPLATGVKSVGVNRGARTVAEWFATRSIPVFAVKGNHDAADACGAFAGGTDVSGRIVEVQPHLFVAGIGWHGEWYYELPMEADLRPVCASLLRQARRVLGARDRVVLVSHYPGRFPELREVPGDKDGAGVWYDCVREVIDELRPLAAVQGHVHQWAQTSFVLPRGDRNVLGLFPGPAGAVLTVDVEAAVADFEWATGGS